MNKLKMISLGLSIFSAGIGIASGYISDKQQDKIIAEKVAAEVAKHFAKSE